MHKFITALRNIPSWLARRLTGKPEKYCLKCRKYRKILLETHNPNYRIVEYDLECGHTIWEKEEREKALDRW